MLQDLIQLQEKIMFFGGRCRKRELRFGQCFLGAGAGYTETGSNQLIIGNSSGSKLLHGFFDTQKLRVNGELEIYQAYTFPIADGNSGLVMATDGAGNLYWKNTESSFIQNQIGDGKVEVSNTLGADSIHFYLDGVAEARLEKTPSGTTRLNFPDNSFNLLLGNAGANSTLGAYNTFVGALSAESSDVSGANAFFGYASGHSSQGAGRNTYLGPHAGQGVDGADNVFIGYKAGKDHTGSDQLIIDNSETATPLVHGFFDTDKLRVNGTLEIGNEFTFPSADGSNGQVLATDGNGQVSWSDNSTNIIKNQVGDAWVEVTDGAGPDSISFYLDGDESLRLEKTADDITRLSFSNNSFNVLLGGHTGDDTDAGTFNTFVGYSSGDNHEGSRNTFLGYDSGQNGEGDWNTHIGYGAGEDSDGDNNIFIGKNAGEGVIGDDLLIIESGFGTALINGNFATNRVGINRTPSTNTFEVGGNASKSSAGDWLANSDQRLKKNIQSLDSENMLEKLLQLKGVQYEWNDDKTGYERPEGTQLGFIAQDIQKVFPDFVQEDADGYLQTAYGTYDPIYVEAFRELTNRLELLEKENNELKAILAGLQSAVQSLQSAVEKMPAGNGLPTED